MKYLKIIILLVSLFTCSSVSAQRIIETFYGDQPAIAVPLYTSTVGFDRVYLLLTHKNLPIFTKKLQKSIRKFGKWSNASDNNNITNFKKPLLNDLEFDCLCYEYDSIQYATSMPSITPCFYADEKGNIFLRFEGWYDGLIGEKVIVETDTYAVKVGSTDYSPFASAAKVGKPIHIDYSLQVPKSDIVDWIYMLVEADNKMKAEKEARKKIEKRNKKLFK